MNQESIEALKQALTEDVVSVKFVKVDGTVRDMNCTLCKNQLLWVPDEDLLRNMNMKTSMIVWDVDAGDWRRFKNENVISWQQNSVQN